MPVNISRELAPFWFTPSDQESEDQPAEYRLRPLKQIHMLELGTMGAIQPDGTVDLDFKAIQLVLRRGMTSWKNIRLNGEPVEFNHQDVENIPAEHLGECVQAIVDASMQSGEQEKN